MEAKQRGGAPPRPFSTEALSHCLPTPHPPGTCGAFAEF